MSLLILRKRLGMIDDENLRWAHLRLQFQPELLLKRCEDRGAGRFGRRCIVNLVLAAWHPLEQRKLALIWRPVQCEIIVARERGLIENVAVQLPRQQARQVRHAKALNGQEAFFHVHVHQSRASEAIKAPDSVRVGVARC